MQEKEKDQQKMEDLRKKEQESKKKIQQQQEALRLQEQRMKELEAEKMALREKEKSMTTVNHEMQYIYNWRYDVQIMDLTIVRRTLVAYLIL